MWVDGLGGRRHWRQPSKLDVGLHVDVQEMNKKLDRLRPDGSVQRGAVNAIAVKTWTPSLQYLFVALIEALAGAAGVYIVGGDLFDDFRLFALLAFLGSAALLIFGLCSLVFGLSLRMGSRSRAARFWFPASREREEDPGEDARSRSA